MGDIADRMIQLEMEGKGPGDFTDYEEHCIEMIDAFDRLVHLARNPEEAPNDLTAYETEFIEELERRQSKVDAAVNPDSEIPPLSPAFNLSTRQKRLMFDIYRKAGR